MVFVRAIVFRAQHCAEPLARTAMDDAQEFALGRSSAAPVPGHRNPASVFEHEARNVDRLSGRMGRTTVGTRNIATGIAPHRLDPRERAAKYLSRRPIHAKACPIAEIARDLALDRADIAHAELGEVTAERRKLHRPQLIATGRSIGVGKRIETRSCSAELGQTGCILRAGRDALWAGGNPLRGRSRQRRRHPVDVLALRCARRTLRSAA